MRFSFRVLSQSIHGLLATIACASFVMAEGDWPQFRGPNRDGQAAPQSLKKSWPEGGPKLAWSYSETGAGYSSISTAGDRLYTLGKINNRATAICLDLKTGKKVWATDFADAEVGKTYNTGWSDGPRSTPTIDGDRVYCIGDLGTLACLDRNKGTILWSRDFVKEFGGNVPSWGFSESVLIDGDKVICTPGGKALLVGLNKNTGETVWESKTGYGAQYVSVVKATFEGTPVYLTAVKEGLVAYDAASGEELFKNEKTGNRTAVIPNPIVSGNRIYHSSAYGAGNVALDVSKENGKLVAKEVYAFKTDSMENHHGGYILYNGTIFGFSKSSGGSWLAQDLQTGKTLWSKNLRSGKSGSIAFADGMLYCYDEAEGVCFLAKPSTTGWEPVGQVKIPEVTGLDRKQGKIWAHPVIADKKLFLRDQEKLFAFDIAE